ncbi:5-formyltetrahydrofolate cyclo-ligase [bacterium]|jgi:methylenetetrahydrofolate dehydrogenase (NADP+) / methenyltetrahydrofolate cyclohydrolase|nr:5-formyltetrahydrofolate cyclo-ligase [bacterium]
MEEKKQIRSSIVYTKNLVLTNNINKSFFQLHEVVSAKNIGLYHSFGHEVDTKKIIEILLAMKKRVYLPSIVGRGLCFSRIESVHEVQPGKFGVSEPLKNSQKIDVEKLDLIVVPCVAVDEERNRLGRGGGYYDRLIAQYDVKKTVSLVSENQIFKSLPVQDHDKKIDIIISEKRVLSDSSSQPKILNGTYAAHEVAGEIKNEIVQRGIAPKLAVILMGSSPASIAYVNMKRRRCEQVGIKCDILCYGNQVLQKQILDVIGQLNNDSKVNGILVQLPLPGHIDTEQVLNSVSKEKDVDGLSNENQKNFGSNQFSFVPCTPKGIVRLLEFYGISAMKKKVVIVGTGRLVGAPLSKLLRKNNIDLVLCDKRTKNIKEKIKQGDIIVSATGVANLIGADCVKHGAVILDAGCAKVGGKLVGDVDFNSVISRCSNITPVPGGIGPMTIAMLLENVLTAYKRQNIDSDDLLVTQELRRFSFHL